MNIEENQTAGELHDALSDIGAEIVFHTVNLIENGNVHPTKQDEQLASAAPKIFRPHCKIDWNNPAATIHNFIRGLSPHPGAYTFYENTQLKILRTKVTNAELKKQPGTILECENKILVQTSNGAIEILELQKEGKKKMFTQEFLRGFHFKIGEKFS